MDIELFFKEETMGKYDELIIMKRVTPKRSQTCSKCKKGINVGEICFCEFLRDKRINFMGKYYHLECQELSSTLSEFMK